MKDIKITVVRKANYLDLMEKYENPITHACALNEKDTFIVKDLVRPKDFCDSAWQSLYPFILTLSCGGSDIYDGWMKNKNSALISCNDGFRPVSFLIEVI